MSIPPALFVDLEPSRTFSIREIVLREEICICFLCDERALLDGSSHRFFVAQHFLLGLTEVRLIFAYRVTGKELMYFQIENA